MKIVTVERASAVGDVYYMSTERERELSTSVAGLMQSAHVTKMLRVD